MSTAARKLSRASTHPLAPEIERMLDEIGANWEFKPKVGLQYFDEKGSLDNQVRFQPLNEDAVLTYGEAMEAGERRRASASAGVNKIMDPLEKTRRGQHGIARVALNASVRTKSKPQRPIERKDGQVRWLGGEE